MQWGGIERRGAMSLIGVPEGQPQSSRQELPAGAGAGGRRPIGGHLGTVCPDRSGSGHPVTALAGPDVRTPASRSVAGRRPVAPEHGRLSLASSRCDMSGLGRHLSHPDRSFLTFSRCPAGSLWRSLPTPPIRPSQWEAGGHGPGAGGQPSHGSCLLVLVAVVRDAAVCLLVTVGNRVMGVLRAVHRLVGPRVTCRRRRRWRGKGSCRWSQHHGRCHSQSYECSSHVILL